MGRRPNRGDTKAARFESYRIDAIEYVTNRDAKIAEIVADIRGKYPRLSQAEAVRIVTEHWAGLEAANDVRNMVRSNVLGYDERKLSDRVKGRLRGGYLSSLDSALQTALRPAQTLSRPILMTDAVLAEIERTTGG